MSIIVNNTTIENVYFNGRELDTILYNGEIVYETEVYNTDNTTYILLENNTDQDIDIQNSGLALRFVARGNSVIEYKRIYADGTESGVIHGTSVSSGSSSTALLNITTKTFQTPITTLGVGEKIYLMIRGGAIYTSSNQVPIVTTTTPTTLAADLVTRVILGNNTYQSASVPMNYLVQGLTNIKYLYISKQYTGIRITDLPKLRILRWEENPTANRNMYQIVGTALETIRLPSNITQVTGKFSNNTELTSVYIPNKTCKIDTNGLFQGCTKLKDVYIWTTSSQTNPSSQGANSLSKSWVLDHPNPDECTIHLSSSLNAETAAAKFGAYFNVVDTTGRTVNTVFDLN